MVAHRRTYLLAGALLVVVFACLVNAQPLPAKAEGGAEVENEPLALLDGNGDDVDLIFIEENEDPRGIVLRRWRRFIRSVLFHPFRPFKKIVAAMVIPGTIAGAIAGTVASSIVGVGAGGVTGGIAGAGLGGLGGILVPTVRFKRIKFKSKDGDLQSKLPGKDKRKKGEEDDEDENEEEDDGNVVEVEEDEDDDDDDTGDDEEAARNSDDLGRNAPFEGDSKERDSEKMVLLLRGGVTVDRLYELRKKLKLLKIKKKFETRPKHFLWN